MNAYARATENQALAADPARSVFVTANAGSGKTKVLIDRIARLLLAGAQPSSFLCITYTKAAAAEMQRRLFERLGAWCVADDSALKEDLEKLVGVRLASETMTKARALFAHALESPGGLKIQTIHAFCERLLARFPLEASVPPGFEIADDARAQEALAEAWARISRAQDGDVDAALARFAARLPDDRFRALMRAIVDRRGDLQTYARASAAATRASLAERHGARSTATEIVGDCLADLDWDALAHAADRLSRSGASDRRLADRIRAAEAAHEKRSDDCFALLCNVFMKKNGEERRDAPTKKLREAEPWLDRLFSDDGEQGRVLRAVAQAKAAERAEDCAAVLVLARALDSAYEQAKSRRGALDFADLIEKAHALLTQADCAPWVLYKLDGGLDHILIDEGQDTSPEQWALLKPLQEEFFAGAGGRDRVRTMFAVGDPKQSIYSFQGADPQKFREELIALDSRARAAGQDFAAPNLEMSFRSAPEILAAVDATFQTQLLGGDMPGAFDELHHDARREGERGRVEWWPLAPRPQRPEARPWDAPLDIEPSDSAPVRLSNEIVSRVRSWILAGEAVWEKGSLRPMRAGDVLVLVRTRGPLFRQLLKAFKRAGFPVAGADRMVLKDELAVEDCLTLLRVALDPADNLALACLLKSPWIGLTDDDRDLFPLAHGRAQGETLLSWLERADARYALAREFARRLREQAGGDPYSLLSWALETLDAHGRSGWERLFARLGAEARDPVEELLARALVAYRRGPASLHAFLAEIERDEAEVKRELEGAGESVRVMTVHGAKGLESPVVILPDTSAGPKNRADPDLFIAADGPVFSASAKDDDDVCARARAEAEISEKGEFLRLLYVAMTRARDRLILCGAARGQGAGGAHAESWHAIVGSAMQTIGTPIETPFGPGFALGDTLSAPHVERATEEGIVLPDWATQRIAASRTAATAAPSKLRKESPALSPRGDGQKRFRRGLIIHNLLQRLPDAPPPSREATARAWLARRGLDGGEAEDLIAETLAVLNDPRFAHVFGEDSRAEAPIVGRVQGLAVRGIVDRLVVRAEEVEILDFKSDRPSPARAEDAPEGYVMQMALYRAVLAQIFPRKRIRCALLWTEKPLLVELSAAQMDAALAGLGSG